MDDLRKRQEARRRKILQSSEERLKRIERLKRGCSSQDEVESWSNQRGQTEGAAGLPSRDSSESPLHHQRPAASPDTVPPISASCPACSELPAAPVTDSVFNSVSNSSDLLAGQTHGRDTDRSPVVRARGPGLTGLSRASLDRDLHDSSVRTADGLIQEAQEPNDGSPQQPNEVGGSPRQQNEDGGSPQQQNEVGDDPSPRHPTRQDRERKRAEQSVVSFKTLVFAILAVVTRLWIVAIIPGQSIILLFVTTEALLIILYPEQPASRSRAAQILCAVLSLKGVSPERTRQVRRALGLASGAVRDLSMFLFVFVVLHQSLDLFSPQPIPGEPSLPAHTS